MIILLRITCILFYRRGAACYLIKQSCDVIKYCSLQSPSLGQPLHCCLLPCSYLATRILPLLHVFFIIISQATVNNIWWRRSKMIVLHVPRLYTYTYSNYLWRTCTAQLRWQCLQKRIATELAIYQQEKSESSTIKAYSTISAVQ